MRTFLSILFIVHYMLMIIYWYLSDTFTYNDQLIYL